MLFKNHVAMVADTIVFVLYTPHFHPRTLQVKTSFICYSIYIAKTPKVQCIRMEIFMQTATLVTCQKLTVLSDMRSLLVGKMKLLRYKSFQDETMYKLC